VYNNLEIIEYKNHIYPKFQSEGFASQFIIPFAKKVCKGVGVDIGCNRLEWMFGGEVCNSKNSVSFDDWLESVKESNFISNSFPIDPVINEYDALNFPENCKNLDYIFSSHCLEHIPDWISVLDYWTSKLKKGGILFLYLPDYSQVYWRPWNNRKHINILSSEIISDYLEDRQYSYIFKSGVDLNSSFAVISEK
jgi:SAM-dependent methyltransferase